MYNKCNLRLSRSDKVGILRNRLSNPDASVRSVLYENARQFRDDLFPEAKILG